MVRGFSLLGGGIKSVQRGKYTMSNASSGTENITISPVDASKSIVLISYRVIGGGTNNVRYVYGRILDSTTLSLVRNTGSSTVSVQVSWQVIEYDSSVTVQSGYLAISTAPQDVTVSAVDLSKSFLVASFATNWSSVSQAMFFRYHMLNNTTIRFEDSETMLISWYLVSFP